jgi:tetratricopeptide (TPR) repeat protein
LARPKPASPRKPAQPPAHRPARVLTDWKARAALAAIALAAYANSFSSGLVQDAQALLTLDDRIRALTLHNLRLIFERTYWWPKVADGLYRPITTLSLLFNYALLGGGRNPAGYHAVNFLLHAGNVCLAYALARRVLGDARAAFLAAALWAVHPIGVEAVANIAGRADLLAAMCVLGGLLLYARLDGLAGWRARAAVAGLFAIAAAGVFSKENAAVLLGLMALWDSCRAAPPGPPGRLRGAAYAAVAASLALLWMVRAAVLGAMPSPQVVYVDNPLRATGFLVARWTAIKAIAIDLGLLLWPAGLSCDRSYRAIALAGGRDPAAWISLAIVAALLAAAIARRRRDRVAFFAAGFFAIAVLPTSNLVVPIGSIMAERFLYLPSVAFAVLLAALAFRAVPRKAATLLLGAAVALCACRTFARNFAWHDNLALASTDVETVPASFKLHDMLAKSLYDQDPQGNLDRAIAEEERAWAILQPLPPRLSTELTPSYLGVYYRLKGDASGGPRSAQGRPWYEKSVSVLRRAREISRAGEAAFDETQRAAGKPLSARGASPDLYLNLAAALLGLDRYGEALEAARYGLGLDPRRTEATEEMALAWMGMGRPREAAVAMEERGLMEGFQAATTGGLAELYGKVPEGSCAVRDGQLNLQCPAVARDLCRASAELAAAHREARMYADAGRIAENAASRYGCRQ